MLGAFVAAIGCAVAEDTSKDGFDGDPTAGGTSGVGGGAGAGTGGSGGSSTSGGYAGVLGPGSGGVSPGGSAGASAGTSGSTQGGSSGTAGVANGGTGGTSGGGSAGTAAGSGGTTGGSGGTTAGSGGKGGSSGSSGSGGKGGSSGSSGSSGSGGKGGSSGSSGSGGKGGSSGSSGSGGSGGVVGGGPTGCPGGTTFCDDFEDGNEDGWTQSSPSAWTVTTDGSFVYTTGPTGNGQEATAGAGWADQRVEAWVKITTMGGTSDTYGAGIMARASGSNFLVFRINGAGSLIVQRNTSNISGCNAIADSLDEDTWYRLTMDVSGAPGSTTITTYLNGVQKHSCVASLSTDYTSGQAGVMTRNGATVAVFDDVKVWSPIP